MAVTKSRSRLQTGNKTTSHTGNVQLGKFVLEFGLVLYFKDESKE